MSSRSRKLLLTLHIASSVGWFGAVAAFLVLAVAGVTSEDVQLARASYLLMEPVAWYVIVPLCLASFLSGIIQSLSTRWGLFRHYWILVKLILTFISTLLLLLHLDPISYMALVAATSQHTAADLSGLRVQLVADAAAGMLVLLVITAISVYKPWGKIQYAAKEEYTKPAVQAGPAAGASPRGKYMLIGIAALILIILLVHLAGGGMKGH
jgi:hypothetical protein